MPAILVPGTLCDRRVFEPLLARLHLDAAVASIDHASIAAAGEAILATAPARFLAIGFSLGGFVVLELLHRAVGRLNGVVLIASHGHPDTPAAKAERSRQAELLGGGTEAYVAAMWPRLVAARALSDQGLRQTIGSMAAGFDLSDFATQSALAASRRDCRKDGAAIVPVLVIVGDEDALCLPERSRAIAEILGGEFLSIPGSGHFVPLEDADAVADAIGAWMTTSNGQSACC